MRFLIILVLAGVCVWLFSEKSRLEDEVASLKTSVENASKRISDADQKLSEADLNLVAAKQKALEYQASAERLLMATPPPSPPHPAPPVPTKSWLDTHLDKSARALDAPGTRSR